jgi:UDP-glucose 4-epimerase
MLLGLTGGSGFIGSYLLRHLRLAPEASLRVLATPGAAERLPSRAGVEVMIGDLGNPLDCVRFVKGLDVLFHLAHRNAPVNSDVSPVTDAVSNLLPFLNLIEAVRMGGRQPHVVYFSSGGAIYRPGPALVPFTETDPCEPSSSYGIQKLAAEHYLRVESQHGALTCSVLRVANAYGELLPPDRKQGLIGVALANVLQNRPVRIFGNVSNVRDYVHLEDICAAAEAAVASRSPYSILNVGSGCGHSVLEVLGIIEECLGKRIDVRTEVDTNCGRWLSEWAVLDTSKAERELGWKPRVTLDSGIRQMCHPYLADNDGQYTTVGSRRRALAGGL